MPWRASLRVGATKGLRAMRDQAAAGACLWVIAVVVLIVYSFNAAFARLFGRAGNVNEAAPRIFAFATFALCGGALPGLLLLAQKQAAKPAKPSVGDAASTNRCAACVDLVFNSFVFGVFGLWVGAFYGLQAQWFGAGRDAGTLLIKVLVDEFVATPVLHVPYLQLLFKFRNWRFPNPLKFARLLRDEGSITSQGLLSEWWFPALFPTWLVWCPCLLVIYSLPQALQLPMNIIVTTFWGLLMQLSGENKPPAEPDAPDRHRQRSLDNLLELAPTFT
ncbi:hypothetical protein M885DRAFT_617382 [Pelagophyceae sp. CCMP2097]|nr:hypothetical protein M885DRAFT_617382 [Pelagophyceae sp. CCMP2097]